MKKRLAMITLVFCCCSVLPMTSFAASDEKTLHNIGPQAVWQPSSEAMQKIREDCSAAAGPALGECFVRGMKASGASAEALAFTGLTGASAFLKGFMEKGRVSVAQVEYPFRANENEGILLVNGFPRMIDVDDLSLLPKSELQSVLSASVRARFFFAGRASAAMASFEWAGRTAGHWRL